MAYNLRENARCCDERSIQGIYVLKPALRVASLLSLHLSALTSV